MSKETNCRKCGAPLTHEAREGVCPKCLLGQALLDDTEPASESGPNVQIDPLPPALPEGPGTVIGRYKLLEKIGEGGFGVVYMAEQEEPVRRRVALKIIKLGMDTREVVGRFEAERQALALMDHPNIAKVFDGGATDTGRPYFVMELVRGTRITDFCDQEKCTPRQRLELFMQVCQAVQHAHQKGIIHRDLKPSNILVTIREGVPAPKVIDFGIAKATEQRLTNKTLLTRFLQLLGTPAYMSPEQMGLTSLDIDTRSDIYSLGALLYELLTGQTPFDAKELLKAGVDEMRRHIREEEPPKPSTRLSTLTAAAQKTTGESRSLEGSKLIHIVRGDLDWIVMKCLEKERTRRYDTTSALAADIARHLNNEPVAAGPPSHFYRFRKFVRRRRAAATATAAIAIALVLGLVATTWQMRIAIEAVKREAQERKAAVQSAAVAAQARDEAQRTRTQSEATARRLSDMLTDMEIQRVSERFRTSPGDAVALLARLLRLDPENRRAAYPLLLYLTQAEVARPILQREFSEPIKDAAFPALGPLVATQATNGQASVWELRTGRLVAKMWSDVAASDFLRFSPSGDLLWTLHNGTNGTATLRMAFARNGREHATIVELPQGRVEDRHVKFSRDELKVAVAGRVSRGSQDQGWAAVVDIRSGAMIGQPSVLQDVFLRDLQWEEISDSLILSFGGRGSNDEIWKRFDPRSGLLEDTLPQPSFVSSPGPRPGDSWQCLLRTYKERSTLALSPFPLPGRNRRHYVPFYPSMPDLHGALWIYGDYGTQFLAAMVDSSVAQLWDTSIRSAVPLPCPLPESLVRGATYTEVSKDGRYVLLLQSARWTDTQSQSERTLRIAVWDVATGGTTLIPVTGAWKSTQAKLSPDGQRVLTAVEGRGRLWSATTGKALTDDLPIAGVQSLKWSGDALTFVTTSTNGACQLWSAISGKPLSTPLVHGARQMLSAISQDAHWLAFLTEAGVVEVLDGFKATWVAKIELDAPITRTEFSPDAQLLLTLDQWNTVRFWDPATGAAIGSAFHHEQGVKQTRFSSQDDLLLTLTTNRRVVVSGSVSSTHSDNVLRTWNLATGQLSVRYPFPYFEDILLGGQGTCLLYFVSTRPDLQVYDLRSGALVMQLGPYAGLWADGSASRQFSPDAQRVLSWTGISPVVAEFPQIDGPAPDWLPEIAEALVCRRVNQRGDIEAVPMDRFAQLQSRLQSLGGTNVFAQWGRWFLTEGPERRISPYSQQTLAQFQQQCIASDNSSLLDQAIAIDPTRIELVNELASRQLTRLLELNLFPNRDFETRSLSSTAIQYLLGTGRKDAWVEERLQGSEVPAARTISDFLLGQDPTHPLGLQLQVATKLFAGANSNLVEILDLVPDDDSRAWAYWLLRGAACDREDRNNEADRAFTRAIEVTQSTIHLRDTIRSLVARREFLEAHGRLAEARRIVIKIELLQRLEPRPADLDPRLLDLTLFYSSKTASPDCGPVLGGTPFDTRGYIAEQANGIPVRCSLRQLHFLQADRGVSSNETAVLGRYTIHYANGQKSILPVVRGQNVRPWPPRETNQFEVPMATLVHFGNGPSLYRFTWTNPYPEVAVQSLDMEAPEEDASLILFAVTADDGGSGRSPTQDPLAQAELAWAKDRREQGLTFSAQAVATYPECARAWRVRGSFLMAAEQYPEALEAFTKAIQVAAEGGLPQNDIWRSALKSRSTLLTKLNRPEEARRDHLQASLGIPPRDVTAVPNLINLDPQYNAGFTPNWYGDAPYISLVTLQSGVHTLSGTSFDLRGLVQIGLQLTNYPAAVSNILVRQSCLHLHFLHAAIHAAETPEGTEIGHYVVHFAEGPPVAIPIVAGQDVADWYAPANDAPKRFVIAWRGENPRDRRSKAGPRLFKTTWDNPRPETTIQTIDFLATDPVASPFLVSLTAEP